MANNKFLVNDLDLALADSSGKLSGWTILENDDITYKFPVSNMSSDIKASEPVIVDGKAVHDYIEAEYPMLVPTDLSADIAVWESGSGNDKVTQTKAIYDYIKSQGFITTTPDDYSGDVKDAQQMLQELNALLNDKNLYLFVRQDGVRYDQIGSNWKTIIVNDSYTTAIFKSKPANIDYDADKDDIIYFKRIQDAVNFSQHFKFLNGASLHICICSNIIFPLQLQYKSEEKTISTATADTELSAYSTRFFTQSLQNVDGCSIYVKGFEIKGIKKIYAYNEIKPNLNPAEFDPRTTYNKYDLVNHENKTYQCIAESYKGEWLDASFKEIEIYEDSTSYNDNDIVFYRDNDKNPYVRYVYTSSTSSSGSTPPSDSNFKTLPYYAKSISKYYIAGYNHYRQVFIDQSALLRCSYGQVIKVINTSFLQNLIFDGFKARLENDKNEFKTVFSNYLIFTFDTSQMTTVSKCAFRYFAGSVLIGQGITANNTSIIRCNKAIEAYSGHRITLDHNIELIDNDTSNSANENAVIIHNYNTNGGIYISTHLSDENLSSGNKIFDVNTGSTIRFATNQYRSPYNAYWKLSTDSNGNFYDSADGLYEVSSNQVDSLCIFNMISSNTSSLQDLSAYISNPNHNYVVTYGCDPSGTTSAIGINIANTDQVLSDRIPDLSSYMNSIFALPKDWSYNFDSMSTLNNGKYEKQFAYSKFKDYGNVDGGYIRFENNNDVSTDGSYVIYSGYVKNYFNEYNGIFDNYESARLDVDDVNYKKFLGRIQLNEMIQSEEFKTNYNASNLSTGGNYITIEAAFLHDIDISGISKNDFSYDENCIYPISCVNNTNYFNTDDYISSACENTKYFNPQHNINAIYAPKVLSDALSGISNYSGADKRTLLYIISNDSLVSTFSKPDGDIWIDDTSTISIWYETPNKWIKTEGSLKTRDSDYEIRTVEQSRLNLIYNVFCKDKNIISIDWSDFMNSEPDDNILSDKVNLSYLSTTIGFDITSAEYRLDPFYDINAGRDYQDTTLRLNVPNESSSTYQEFNTLSGRLSCLQRYLGYSYAKV